MTHRSRAIQVIFISGIAVYPFVVYFGIRVLPPSFFGLVLVVLLAARFGVLQPEERQVLLPVLGTFLTYALATSVIGSETMLLYYPALVNFCLSGVFLSSLRYGEPLLLRFVRARGMPISKHGPKYLRRLTAIWALFFALNGTASIATVTMTMATWTLYNGLVAYLVAGSLIGGELLFRRYYKRRMRVEER